MRIARHNERTAIILGRTWDVDSKHGRRYHDSKTCKAQLRSEEPTVRTIATQKARSNSHASHPQNQCQSPLLRLSSELRNKIYSYVFSVDISVANSSRHTESTAQTGRLYKLLSAQPRHLGTHRIPKLSRVCRQLHAETALLPFGKSTFTIDGWYRVAENCHAVIHRLLHALLPSQRGTIRTYRLAGRTWRT